MARLQIIDTGYVDKGRTTTVDTQVNSGTALDFTETAQLRYTNKANIDVTPEPSVYGKGSIDANFISVEQGQYDLTLTLLTNNTAHQTLLKHIVGVFDNATYPGLLHTEGVKALVISGTSDSKKTLVELIGSTGTEFHDNEITAGLPAILVHVESIRVENASQSNALQVRMSLVEA